MKNGRIVKGRNVKKYLDTACKNGWKIAKRIYFANNEYNYHLIPENGSDGYICMWCKGEEFEAQYNAGKYHDDNYKGETLYETRHNKSTLYMGIQFKEA